MEVENQPEETETLLFTVVAPLGTIPPNEDWTASLDVHVVPVDQESSPDRVEIALERTNAYGAWMLAATAAGPHAELTTLRDVALFSDCDPTEQCVREVAVHIAVFGDVQANYAVRVGAKLGRQWPLEPDVPMELELQFVGEVE